MSHPLDAPQIVTAGAAHCAAKEYRKIARTLAFLMPMETLTEILAECRLGAGLTFLRCDGWKILATDGEGAEYFLHTECWPEWNTCPPGSDLTPNAVARFMLPIAKKKWNRLLFRASEADDRQ